MRPSRKNPALGIGSKLILQPVAPIRHASIPHMLERFGNVLYWVCAIAAVGLTAIMLATVLTHGADLTGIGISVAIGALIWFIGWAIRLVVSG